MFRMLVVLLSSFVVAAAAEPAREISSKQLKQLLAKAATPADHLRLAAHFEAKAKRYEAEAAEHVAAAGAYRIRPTPSEEKRPMAPDTAGHCDYIAESLKKAAANARDLVAAHRRMSESR